MPNILRADLSLWVTGYKTSLSPFKDSSLVEYGRRKLVPDMINVLQEYGVRQDLLHGHWLSTPCPDAISVSRLKRQ